jgi:Luciferase-like monooxygenase
VAAVVVTTALRLGGYVYDNDFLYPVLLAREAAEIGVLSDGRMELGIGAGWPGANTRWPASHSTPGRPEPRFEEAVHIIRSLHNRAAVTHSDEFYELEECELSVEPVQHPIPLLLGGGGTRLDDLIESASRSPMVLLRSRALLTTLLNTAPPARQPPITRRLHRAEELGAANFPLIWHDATGGGRTSQQPARS